MLRRGTQQQVRIRDFALVMGLLLVRQPGKRRAIRCAAQRERPGAVAMRNAVVPVETCAAALAERRHERAQLRVHGPAVIALVVVLHDHFPVGAHVVDELRATTQILRADSAPACARAPRAARAATAPAWLPEVQKDESAPGVEMDRHEREAFLRARRIELHVGCCAQRAVEVVGPRVIRTHDGAADALEVERVADGWSGSGRGGVRTSRLPRWRQTL